MKKILMGVVFLMSLSCHGWAANFSDPVDGVFKNVSGDALTIEVPSQVSKSPDDGNGDLDFALTPDTVYSNFQKLSDLKAGDPVRVEYKEDPNSQMKKRVAVGITRLDQQTVTTTTTTRTTETQP